MSIALTGRVRLV